MHTRHGCRNCGFTLIELLVVMTIIAVLLTIVAPRYFEHVDRARDTTLRQDLAVMRDAIDKFQADKGRLPETLDELVEQKYLRTVPVDPITESRESWVVEEPKNPEEKGVYDVHSGAPGKTKDGVAYADL